MKYKKMKYRNKENKNLAVYIPDAVDYCLMVYF